MGWPGPPTSRQVRAARAWLDLEYERPTVTQQYLISIATEARRGYSGKPRRVKMDDLRLRFRAARTAGGVGGVGGATTPAPPTKEQIADAKARFRQALGRPIRSTPAKEEG